jgi:hypothetical protein
MSLDRNQVKEALKALLNDPEIKASAVDAITEKKPKSFAPRSVAPYYKERFAKQIRDVLDAMVLDREPRMFHYESFPSHSPDSLYLRINQSFRYLYEHMDTEDKKYFKLKEEINVSRVRGKGVLLAFDDSWNGDTFTPVKVLPPDKSILWKDKMEKWIETSEVGENFVQEGLTLSPEEVLDYKRSFAGIDNIWASISSKAIKLVKVNPESIKE